MNASPEPEMLGAPTEAAEKRGKVEGMGGMRAGMRALTRELTEPCGVRWRGARRSCAAARSRAA